MHPWVRVRARVRVGLGVGLGASELLIADCRFAIPGDRPVADTGYTILLNLTSYTYCLDTRIGQVLGQVNAGVNLNTLAVDIETSSFHSTRVYIF